MQRRPIEGHVEEGEFVVEPLLGPRQLANAHDSEVFLHQTSTTVQQRGYAFSQDEGGPITQAEIAMHENTDTRFAERMARRSRDSVGASTSTHGSPRSLAGGRDLKVKGGAKIKHL